MRIIQKSSWDAGKGILHSNPKQSRKFCFIEVSYLSPKTLTSAKNHQFKEDAGAVDDLHQVNVSCVPGTALSTSHILSHLINQR